MTEKQKQAIEILNHHLSESAMLTKEEYFMLMDIVIDCTPQIQYIPFQQPSGIQPYETYCQTK